MRYSAFEQAAAEASIGLREIDIQLEQLSRQLEQLKAKRDLLDTVQRQLSALRPAPGEAAPQEQAPAASMSPMAAAPAEAPAAHGSEPEPEMVGAAVYEAPRNLREGWFTRGSSNGDSGIRGRL